MVGLLVLTGCHVSFGQTSKSDRGQYEIYGQWLYFDTGVRQYVFCFGFSSSLEISGAESRIWHTQFGFRSQKDFRSPGALSCSVPCTEKLRPVRYTATNGSKFMNVGEIHPYALHRSGFLDEVRFLICCSRTFLSHTSVSGCPRPQAPRVLNWSYASAPTRASARCVAAAKHARSCQRTTAATIAHKPAGVVLAAFASSCAFNSWTGMHACTSPGSACADDAGTNSLLRAMPQGPLVRHRRPEHQSSRQPNDVNSAEVWKTLKARAACHPACHSSSVRAATNVTQACACHW